MICKGNKDLNRLINMRAEKAIEINAKISFELKTNKVDIEMLNKPLRELVKIKR